MYLHTPAVEVGSWWRVDTASGSSTPATVYAHDGADPIGAAAGTSGSTIRSTTFKGTAQFWSNTAVLYCKQVDYRGNLTGPVVTSTGATVAAPAALGEADVYPVAPPTGVAALDQAEITEKIAAGAGGVVELQSGTYVLNDEIYLPDSTILRGKGRKATQLYWPTDLGSGKWALRQLDTAGVQDAAPSIEDLSLLGPGNGHPLTMGTAYSSMDGWRAGRNVHGTGIVVKGFRAGIGINGDHNTFFRVKSGNNHYNVLYLDGYLRKGNQTFIGCELDGASWASIAVGNTNTCDSSVFIGGHMGFAPYGIYKFPGASTTGGMMSNCLLDEIAFEAIGNAAMLDESTGTGSGQESLFCTTIINPGFAWDPSYKIPARARDYALDLRNAAGTKIVQPAYPFLSGDVAAISLSTSASYADLVIEGTSPPALAGNCQGTVFRSPDYEATYYLAGAAITAGWLVENGTLPTVQPYGTASRRPVGIAAQSQATVGAPVAIATGGRVVAIMGAAGPSTGGVPLVPDPADLTKLTPAGGAGAGGYTSGSSTAVPGAHPIFAQSSRDIAGGASGLVVIQISPDRRFVQPGAVAALPTAGVAYRGQILRVEGGSGAADTVVICQKQADGSYTWAPLT